PLSAKSGYGVAASAAIHIVDDTTLAYIDARGVIKTNTLALEATNDQITVLFAGGLAISTQTKGATIGQGSTTGAGAFAMNLVTDDTEAYISDSRTASGEGLSVTSRAPDAANVDEVSVKATRSGVVAVLAAAISANTNAQPDANAYSGSVTLNRVNDTTQALIDGAVVSGSGDAAMHAKNDAKFFSFAGGASYTGGAKGVGGSVGFNELSSDTAAGIEGTKRRGGLNVTDTITIDAINDETVGAIAVTLGIVAGSQPDSK